MPKSRKQQKRKVKSRKGGRADNYDINLKNCKNNISEAMCVHAAYKYDFPGLIRSSVLGSYTKPKKLSYEQFKELLKQYYEKNKDLLGLGPFNERNFRSFYDKIPEFTSYNDIRENGIKPYLFA